MKQIISDNVTNVLISTENNIIKVFYCNCEGDYESKVETLHFDINGDYWRELLSQSTSLHDRMVTELEDSGQLQEFMHQFNLNRRDAIDQFSNPFWDSEANKWAVHPTVRNTQDLLEIKVDWIALEHRERYQEVI